MAAGSGGGKSLGLQIFSIIVVMIAILLGVFTYMFYDDGRQLREQLQTSTDELNKQKQAALQRAREVEELKAVLGYENLTTVGERGTPDPNSVVTSLVTDLNSAAGPGLAGVKTVKEALAGLRQQLDETTKNYQIAQAEKTTHEVNMASLDDAYRTRETQFENRATAAETDLNSRVAEHTKASADKDAEIQRLSVQISQRDTEKLQMAQDHKAVVAGMNREIEDLKNANDSLRERLDTVTRVSFEQPDGLIRWVDNTSHLVWINLGTADGVRPRTTFSVYNKGHRGVGRASADPSETDGIQRGPEDIKGAIEVVRVLNAHSSEARIVNEDIYNPIAKGDPIYSPVWSANQSLEFAIVGLIDIDGDGRSDRELLHEIIRANGSKISIEVDDQGVRHPPIEEAQINEMTKFLVIGKTPDPTEQASEKEQQAAMDIGKQRKDLREEARRQGVRVISLSDFLQFIGHQPKQRVYRPGDTRSFTLKSGARSATVDEVLGDRASSGNNAGIYSRSKRLGPTTNEGGNTSNLFRSGSGGY